MTAELKPCPFCGGEAELISNRDWHRIIVKTHEEGDNCALAEEFVSTVHAMDGQLEMLIQDWNTRSIEDALKKENTELREILKEAVQARRIEELETRDNAFVDALSEIKATNDGASDQPISVIVEWLIAELGIEDQEKKSNPS